MKLIVGLGNPGKRYERTRHNVGFMVVDAIAKKTCTKVNKNKFSAKYGEFHYLGEKIVLLKPQTFMNRSGIAVKKWLAFYRSSFELLDMIVIYDDVALDFGAIRIRDKGSSGGHNGIQSIIDELDTNAIPRLRVGIKGANVKGDLADYVLSYFERDEARHLPDIVEEACQAAFSWVDDGTIVTMNKFN
ncbi:MAG: aminoacyl-tRNA hydrolase [Candidatus Omnitrophica bacterium]|nr:aminoacyl-tRNA hydrolase [Candidatus Omnitrophota bacterium]